MFKKILQKFKWSNQDEFIGSDQNKDVQKEQDSNEVDKKGPESFSESVLPPSEIISQEDSDASIAKPMGYEEPEVIKSLPEQSVDKSNQEEERSEGFFGRLKKQLISKETEEIEPISAQSTDRSTQEETKPEGFFARLKKQLTKSKEGFVRRMDELEEILVTADVGVKTASEIFDQIRAEVKRKELNDVDTLRDRIKSKLLELLDVDAPPLTWQGNPCVVLVVGVNGVGKTTTIAKLAYHLKEQGKTCLLAAADTFRAAAIEQLDTWGQRLNIPVIKHKHGSDPSAVAFDAIEAGIKRKVDVVIIDTAGRLHTKSNLMEELKKIRRVIGKKIPDAPHEVFLVLDATTGQNALSQAKLFKEATDLTGIVLTKLDGTAKGGIVVAIAHQMGLPIRFIGIGEKMDDLRPFSAEEFVEALFERGEGEPS